MSRTIEQKAIDLIIQYEKGRGRNAKDVHGSKLGYDIKSTGRYIEVKTRKSEKIGFVKIYDSLIRTLGKNISKYYIYYVYNMKRNPKLIVVGPDVIFKNLETEVQFLLRAKHIKALKDAAKNLRGGRRRLYAAN